MSYERCSQDALGSFAVLICIVFTWVPIISAHSTADSDGIAGPGGNVAEELAKAAQKPVTDLISLPFQNNTNFNFGPENKTQNIFNIQQVWPLSLTVE